MDEGDVQIDESSCFFLEEINHFHLSIHAEVIPQFLFSVCFKVLDAPDVNVSSGVLLVVGRSCVFSSIACSPSYPQSESFNDYSLGEGCTVEQSRAGRVDECCKLYISVSLIFMGWTVKWDLRHTAWLVGTGYVQDYPLE